MLAIYLTLEGQERYIKGQELYSWDYSVREITGDNDESHSPAGAVRIGTLIPLFPSKPSMLPALMASLDEKEAEIQKEAATESAKLRMRRNDLTMLTFEG